MPADPPKAVSDEAAAPSTLGAPPAGHEKRPAPGAARTRAVKNPWPFIVLVVALCVVGWFLVSWMSDTTSIQDCVMSGRKNCAPVDPKLGR
jgi:hypothetical protein